MDARFQNKFITIMIRINYSFPLFLHSLICFNPNNIQLSRAARTAGRDQEPRSDGTIVQEFALTTFRASDMRRLTG